MTTIVTNTILLANGDPATHARVRIYLAGEDGEPVVGYLEDDTAIEGVIRLGVDEDGVWADDLVPNELITPAGTVYRVVERRGRVVVNDVAITVPNEDGTFDLLDLITDFPGALDPPGLELERQARMAADADLQAQIDAVEDSDVDSVNGRTGTVTGLAEQEDLEQEIVDRAEAIVAEEAARDTAIALAVSDEVVARDAAIVLAVAAEAVLARNADNLTSGTVPDARIASTIARDSEVTAAVAAEATLARNAANLLSGTIDDARIPGGVARDSEVTAAVAAEATARDAAIALAVSAEAALARNADNLNSGTVPDARLSVNIARAADVTAEITAAIDALVDSSPGTLDTLNEIAAALGDDPNFATTITTSIGTKVAKSLYDANTIVIANFDDTPVALTVGASTFVGRGAAGGIAAMTAAEAKAVLAITEADVSGLVADLALKAPLASPTFTGTVTLADGVNLAVNTTTGSQIGTTTGQKLGFYGATPVAQIAGTVDVLAGLVTQGLRAASSNPPLNLGSGALTCGQITTATVTQAGAALNIQTTTGNGIILSTNSTTRFTVGSTGNLLAADGSNYTFGTTTGSMIGTTTGMKIGFWGATPVVQPAGSTDVLASLVTLGLRAASSNPPLNLGSGALTAGGSSSFVKNGVNALTCENTGSTTGINATELSLKSLAGGFGSGIDFQSTETGTSTLRSQATIEAEGSASWNSVANASSFLRFSVSNAGTLAECFRFAANGDMTPIDGKNLVLGTGTGMKIGTATGQKIGFHNATPVIQRAGAAQAAVATTAATNITPYGYTQAQADGIITLLNEIRAALVEKGLIKGAA